MKKYKGEIEALQTCDNYLLLKKMIVESLGS